MDIANPKLEIDHNFLPKNPVWGKIANGSGTAPTISDHCPCDSDDPDDWKNAPDCSEQFSHYNSDELHPVYVMAVQIIAYG